MDIFSKKYQDPGIDFYHFPIGPSHLSPCMDPFFRNQPIRQGKKILDIEHDKIDYEEDQED